MDWKAIGLFLAAKIAPLPLFVIAFVSGAILFSGDGLNVALGTDNLRDEHRTWVGLSFMTSTAYLTGMGIIALSRRRDVSKSLNEIVSANRQKLLHLSRTEKEYLARFMQNDTRGLQFSISDPVPHSLLAAGILERPSQLAMADFSGPEVVFPTTYYVTDWAWTLMNEEPELIDFTD